MGGRCYVTFVSQVTQSSRCSKMGYPSFIWILLPSTCHLVTSLRSRCDCCFVTKPRVMLHEFILWFSCERHLDAPLWNHNLRCIGLSHQIITQWSHMGTLRWPTVVDSTVKSPSVIKSQDGFILLSLGDSSQNNFTKQSHKKTWWLFNESHMRITIWLHCNLSSRDSPQSNSYNDFSVESSNKVYLRRE